VPPIPPEASKEIELIKALVAKHFPVYDVRVSYDVVQFFCRVEPTTLEDSFDRMREEMAAQGYIPMITYEKGEHIVQVARKPKMKYRSVYVNLAFLIITIITTTLAGLSLWVGYADVPKGEQWAPESWLMGAVTFAIPLLAILGVHELAHYFMARRRNIAASLPFFIPGPPNLIGTFGALISIRDPIPNRKAMLEIGVAGPIAGFLLSIPLAIIGLILTNDGAKLAPVNESGSMISVSFPAIYIMLEQLFPIHGDYILHPTAFAAWAGLFVTALNLLPVGQLDGGHVARALLGDKARYLSWATLAAMIALSMFFFGWLLLAILVLFLGARHPPPLNDISRLGKKRTIAGVLTLAILLVGFVPQPIAFVQQDYSFDMVAVGDTNGTIIQNGTHMYSVSVNNTGNTLNHVEFAKKSSPNYWTVVFKRSDQNDSFYIENYDLVLNATQNATVNVLVQAAETAVIGNNESIVIKATARNSSFSRELTFNLTVVDSMLITSFDALDSSALPQHAEVARERSVDPKAMGLQQTELVRIV
jgi:membrane-associated protease RseP (regulator of RpoE activity)